MFISEPFAHADPSAGVAFPRWLIRLAFVVAVGMTLALITLAVTHGLARPTPRALPPGPQRLRRATRSRGRAVRRP
jgi:hypothetical protein